MVFRIACVHMSLLAALCAASVAAVPAEPTDARLEAARRYVERSDRYLHHDRLQRGMKGYGLTVLRGTEISRFDVEIVSVLRNFSPHQDAILARLSGQGLEKTQIISGMSGSPVYVRDPADGKDKLIGAVAFSFPYQKEPLCGIQPITQMLAASGMFDEGSAGQNRGSAGSARLEGPAAKRDYLAVVLDPHKIDFSDYCRADNPAVRTGGSRRPAGLVPLSIPLMVSGVRSPMLDRLQRILQPLGVVPVSAGGGGVASEPGQVQLVPGAVISVPVVAGDVDWYFAGTVTDVIGQRVLAFGHRLFGEGDISVPMAAGYVHTVVSNIVTSFKITGTLDVRGALERDEQVGVAGQLGGEAKMIPLTIEIKWPDRRQVQRYSYRICRHRRLTALLAQALLFESAWSWRDLPRRHTVRYTLDVDFGELGRYHVQNVSAGMDVLDAASDATRPIWGLQNNPFGPPAHPERIDVDVVIEDTERSASIEQIELDGAVYRPGDELTGKLIIQPFRKPMQAVGFSFRLPENLPDGRYELRACDAAEATTLQRRHMPHLFDPRSTQELFASLQRAVSRRQDAVYLRLELPTGGVALGQRELPDLPDSKAQLIRQAQLPRTYKFTDVLERAVQLPYVTDGSAAAGFTVRREPTEILLHP